jgi:cobalt-zinc-cadmium efflux system outer membrane protein
MKIILIVRKLVPSVGLLLMLEGTMDAQGPAAEQLTISTAVAEAAIHNPTLTALHFEVQAAEGDLLSAGLRPNPSLTVNGDLLPSDGLSAKDKQYGASLSLPFELGGKRQARMGAAEAARDLSWLRLEDARRETLTAVKTTYIDLASAAVKSRVAEENLRLLDSLVAINAIRVKGQDIAAVDLTRSEVERDKFSVDVLADQQAVLSISASLALLLGRKDASVIFDPDTAVFGAAEVQLAAALPSLDSLYSIAQQLRSDVTIARQSEKAAEAQLEVARSMASIDLTVSLDAMRQQDVTSYGASLTVPLPFFDRHQGEIAKAEAYSGEARSQTQALLLSVRSQICAALIDAQTKQESVRRIAGVLKKSSTVRQSLEYAYRHGSTSLVDYLDVVRTDNELRELYADALGAFAKSLIGLDHSIGKDLFYAVQ